MTGAQLVLPTVPASPAALADATWEDLAPHYEALAEAPITVDDVPAWLAAWSALDTVVDEAASVAYMAYTANTADRDAEARNLRFSMEILPEVEKSVKLSKEAKDRAICGISSGGICAFTAAWERPQAFGKVLSHIGSFTNIRGGDRYPGIIRRAEKKDIRVFLQDGSNDLDNQAGNWYLANLQMEKALQFKKYDVKTVWGDGAHNGKHASAIFPGQSARCPCGSREAGRSSRCGLSWPMICRRSTC